MAQKDTTNPPAGRADARKKPAPPSRVRVKLVTAEDCRRELARLYREARGKRMDVADASRLANMLQIMSRLIETSDLEDRIHEVEEALRQDKRLR